MIIQPSRSATTRISIATYRYLRAGLELWNLFALVPLKGFDERDEGRKIGRPECVEANHHGAISPPI